MDKDNTDELLDIIDHSDNEKKKGRAERSLVRLLENETASALRVRIQNSENKIEIKNARFQLWCKELDRSEGNLSKLLQTCDDEEKLKEVISAIGEKKYRNLIPTLVNILDTTSSWFIRDASAMALEDMPDQQLAYGSLIRAVKNNPGASDMIICCLSVFDCSSEAEMLVDRFLLSSDAPMAMIGIFNCFEDGAVRSISKTVKESCVVKIWKAMHQTNDSCFKEELEELYYWIMRTKVAEE